MIEAIAIIIAISLCAILLITNNFTWLPKHSPRYRGTWSEDAGTYRERDIVHHRQAVYICRKDHKASDQHLPQSDSAHWAVMTVTGHNLGILVNPLEKGQ